MRASSRRRRGVRLVGAAPVEAPPPGEAAASAAGTPDAAWFTGSWWDGERPRPPRRLLGRRGDPSTGVVDPVGRASCGRAPAAGEVIGRSVCRVGGQTGRRGGGVSSAPGPPPAGGAPGGGPP